MRDYRTPCGLRKLKLFLSLLMVMFLSIGQMWATTYKLTKVTSVEAGKLYVFERNSHVFNNTSSSSALQTTATYNTSGLEGTESYVWTLESATGGFYLKNVSLASNQYLNNASKTTVSFGAASSIWTIAFTGEVALISNTSNSNRFLGDAGKDSPNNTYKAYATSNLNDYQHDITVYVLDEEGSTPPTPAKTLVSVAVSGAPTKTSYYAGDNFDPAGLTVTGTYSDESTAPITSGITWSYNPSQTLAANQTSIGVTATVSNIASTEYPVSITVAAAPAADSYELVTNVANLADGDKIIIVNEDEDKAIGGQNSSNRAAVDVTATSHIITPGENVQIITLEASSANWKFKVGEDSYLYASSNSSNQLKSAKATTAGDNGVWAITIANDGTATAIAQGSNGRNEMRYNPNNGNPIFSCYASTSNLDVVKIYKKSDGKQETGLSYAEADRKNLVKPGETFTAPTLVNSNNLSGITYASSNTAVAEVEASTGAITINAVGVAEISATFAGNDTYKAGSASYTIGVTAHAGTQADPYTVADAKIVIDAIETEENVHVAGKVSQIVTAFNSTYGNISFNISEDGTTANQLEAFRCKSFGGAAFTSENDVETGATVVVKGILKKYNSKYELDEGCCLVTYVAPEAPKTPIANTQETAYSVAQALIYAADGLTYDLNDEVFVQGKVAVASSSLFNYKYLTYFISDNGVNENTLKIYNGLDINGASFTSKDDVKVGDIVIVKGKLLEYNSVLELNQNNELVLHKPVATISVENMEIAVGDEPKAIVAEIIPAVAADHVVYSIAEGGDAFISIDAENKISAIAEGVATINVTLADGDTYAGTNASFTVTVNAAAAPVLTDYYEKVTETAGIVEGTYLIVYEDESVAFDGGLDNSDDAHKLDKAINTINVTITNDHKIGVTTETAAATFYLDPAAGTLQAKSGKYIGVTSNSNGLKSSDNADAYSHNFSIDDDDNAVIAPAFDGSTMSLRFNKGTSDKRFRYYKDNGQQPIALYKLANEVVKANSELAWSAESVTITVGDDFTAPTLDNPHSVEGITFASDNTDLATVTNAGVIELIENATGTAHITASFAGDDTYKAVNVACTITVNAAAPTPLPTAEAKVIVVEYNSKFYAMSTTVKNSNGFEPIEVTKENDKIIVKSDEEAAAIQWQIALGAEAATFQNGESKYLACSTESNTGLALLDDASEWAWDATASCYKQPGKDSKERTFYYNYNNGNPIFRAYTVSGLNGEGYSGAPEFIDADKIEVQVPATKIDPELAFDPTEVELTLGETFTAPTLGHVDGFNGTITYSSSKPAVATVDESTGEVTIVANGTTTISASFEGNDDYEEAEASYTITVNKPAPTPTSTIYRKVTATADITDGEYLIVYEGDATHDAAVFDGSLDNDNIDVAKKVLAVEIENDEIAGNTELDAAVFTIDVTAGSLQSASGLYIGRTANSNGMDKSTTQAYVNTFAITDGAAVITSAGGPTLRYNYASDQLRFRYYKSGQQAIQLYKKVVVEPEWETVRENLEANRYYTVCLPKKMMEVRGASFWTLSSRNEAGSMAYLEEVDPTTAEAGTPFIIQATDTKLEVVYTGAATTTAGTNGALRGTLNGIDAEAFAALPGNPYLLINNAIRPRTTGNFLAANRAYIEYSALEVNTPQPAPGRRVRAVPMQQNTATGMENVQGDNVQCTKVLIDGQLFILRGEKMYDVKGQLVK